MNISDNFLILKNKKKKITLSSKIRIINTPVLPKDINPLSKNIITGACLLNKTDVKQLSKHTRPIDLENMCKKHPTKEDLVYTALTYLKPNCNIFYWLETHEFASLVEYKTNISYQIALSIFIEESKNIVRKLQSSCNILVLYTHKNEIDQRLSNLSVKYNLEYIKFCDKMKIELSEGLKHLIRTNPKYINKLRIVITYLPESINKMKASIIEPYHSLQNIQAGLYLGGNIDAILINNNQT